ncbi:MAG: hypothetical protein JKY46_02460 [Robiginitomaculum sp.]|nr:hypothetical protein [Robiginitomaculum sp.]
MQSGSVKLFNTLLSGAAAIALLTSPVSAQEVGDNENIIVYEISFFDIYNPVTALDMVRQVPAFSVNSGGNARGFGGNAGNVLINGERPSTKSTSLEELLQRIPAERVQKIELVTGAVSGLDMRGQIRIVNVTLVEGDTKTKTTWSFQVTKWPKRVIPSGEITQSFKALGADVTLGIQRNAAARRRTETRNLFNVGADLFESRAARSQTQFGEWQPHFNIAKKFNDDNALNLNGKYWSWVWRRTRVEETDSVSTGLSQFDRFDFSSADNTGTGIEIGGDYEHKFNDKKSVKFIFLQRSDRRESDNLFETFDTGGFARATRVISSQANNESILRSVYNWERNDKNSFEASIEGAFNWLKSGLDIAADTGSGFTAIVLPTSNTKVREKRAEAAVSWIAKPYSGWTFETGVKYEISEISQSGDATNARVLKYWKPNFSTIWERNKRDQIRFNLQRNVGQLNFNDFATNIDIIDNQTNVGNIQLLPDASWDASISFERKFGKKGVLTLNASHSWISDVRDLVPINNLFDAPGNIGNGKAWQMSANARIPTDKFGLKNGILTLAGGFGDSAVTDPLTGLTRVQSFRVDDFYRVDFRQELTNWKMAWGFDYFQRSASQGAFLFSQRKNYNGPGDLDFFVETTKVKGATIRFTVENIFNPTNFRERFDFNGTRNLGIVRQTEFREQNSGLMFRLSLRGTF